MTHEDQADASHAFEERAAIREFCGGQTRYLAEVAATREVRKR